VNRISPATSGGQFGAEAASLLPMPETTEQGDLIFPEPTSKKPADISTARSIDRGEVDFFGNSQFIQSFSPPASKTKQLSSTMHAQTEPAIFEESSWIAFGSSSLRTLPDGVAASMASEVSSPQLTSPQRSGPLLYLSEMWESEFNGSKCISSTASGEVGLRKQLWKNHLNKELRFKLSPPPLASK